MVRISSPKDFAAGLIFIGIGAFAYFYAHVYSIGTAFQMGPGFFPALLGGLLALLGLGVAIHGLRVSGAPIERFTFRPLILITAGVVLFSLTVERLGLLVAILLAVLLSRLAEPGFRWREIVLICSVLMLLASVLFVYGLGLPAATLLPP